MSAVIAVSPLFHFDNASGAPLVGGKLYTYLAGTTTPTPTWQDQDQIAANTNPIVLNARGECLLWLDPTLTYRLVLEDALGALIWSVDDVSGALTAGAIAGPTGACLVGYKGPWLGTVATTQCVYDARTLWVEDFGAVGDGATDCQPAFSAAFAAAKLAGGSLVMMGRGEFVLEDTVYIEGSGIVLQGQGPQASILTIKHDQAEALSARNITTPGLLENIALRGFSINYEFSPQPNPETTELLHAEYVKGLLIENVVGAGGKCFAHLAGCSDAVVQGNRWTATDSGVKTGRDGILVDATDATYAGADDTYGTNIRIADNKLTGAGPSATNRRVARGIAVLCGNEVTLAGNVLTLMTLAILVTRSASIAGAILENCSVLGNTVDHSDQAILIGENNTTNPIEYLRIEDNTLHGGLATDAGIESHSAALVYDCIVARNILNGWSLSAQQIYLAAEHLGLVVANNTVAGGAGSAVRVQDATEFAVVGNRLDAPAAVGVLIGTTCNGGTIAANIITDCLSGVSIGSPASNITVQGNAFEGNTNNVTDLAASVSNSIQGAPIAFKAQRATTAQTFTATTATKVLFNAEIFDPYSTFDSGANSRWTPGVLGTYQINATVTLVMPATTGTDVHVSIYKNGAEVSRGSQTLTVANGNYAVTVSSVEQVTAVGDYFEIFITSDAVGTKSIYQVAGLTVFSGSKLN